MADLKRVSVDISTSGDNTIIPAVTGAKLRIVQILVSSNSSMDLFFKSGALTAISSIKYLPAKGVINLPFNEDGHYETSEGEAFVVDLSSAKDVGVDVVYLEVI